jgi:hypothetical protein
LSDIERCRVAFLEILVGHHMTDHRTGHTLRVLESVPSRDLIPKELLSIGLLSLHPMIFPCNNVLLADDDDLPGFVWLTDNLCLRTATRLDDEATLQGSMGELISHITTSTECKAHKGVVYGVLFSIFHCVIASIDLGAGGTCKHTTALPFLPSWYAYTPSTPGITALARLGKLLNFEIEADHGRRRVKIVRSGSAAVYSENKTSRFSTIPEEICYMIVLHLHNPMDILAFGSLSPACKAVAMQILKYPYVDDYRLLKPIPQPPPEMPRTAATAPRLWDERSESGGPCGNFGGDQDDGVRFAFLHSSKFEADAKSGNVVVEVGSSRGPLKQMQHSGRVCFPLFTNVQNMWYGVLKKKDADNSDGELE